MTDHDPILSELLGAADMPDEDFHVSKAAALLDDSSAVIPAPRVDLDRLHRAESEMIEAWGVLHTSAGFQRVQGETLPEAIRRTLSAANLKE